MEKIVIIHAVLCIYPVVSFLFNTAGQVEPCYELDLENCFREAFLAALHPPVRLRKELGFYKMNYTAMEKRKAVNNHQKNFFLCHDVRRLSLCFLYPGCNDHLAASIASVQYHMVFGKKLPMQVFLAYRGFGKQVCDQTCSRDTVFICRRTMTKSEQEEEQENLMELSTLSSHIAPTKDNIGTCDRFKTALTKVLRTRLRNCGDAAHCTCEDSLLFAAINTCNINCETILQQEQLLSKLSHFPIFTFLLTFLLILNLY